MKILYVVPTLDNNGPVNMCLELICAIRRKYPNFDIDVLALGGGDKEDLYKRYSNVFICKRTDLLKIKKILNQNYNFIHSHCFISDLLVYLFSGNTPKFTTLHNCFDLDFIDRKGFLIGKFQSLVAKNIIRSFFKIACSKSVYDYYSNNVTKYKLDYVQNGFGLRREYKLLCCHSIEKLKYFYVGSFIYRKNVEFILENFELWSKDKNVELHLFGDGILYDDLKNKYENLNIIFHGKVSDILSEISELDCIISASQSEGLPMAILEAMSLGKTYICSNIPSHLEIYNSSSQETGIIYNLNDSSDFMNSLDKVYRNRDILKTLCANSQDSYNSNFTAEIMMEKYLYLYRECNSNKGN